MNVTLYIYSGEKNRVDKTNFLKKQTDLECTLKENTSITNPSILIGLTVPLFQVNYCYITQLNRYYFVTDIVIEAKNLYRLNLSVDVLMSYKGSLSGQKAVLNRNEYDSTEGYPNYTIDDRLPIRDYYDKEYLSYAKPFSPIEENDHWMVLTVFTTKGARVSEDSFINPYDTLSRTMLVRAKKDGHIIPFILANIAQNYTSFGSFISSIFLIPFDCSLYIKGEPIPVLTIGEQQFDLTRYGTDYGEYMYDIKPRLFAFSTTSIKIESFLDLPPYSSYHLNLPLYGTVELPVDSIKHFDDKLTVDVVSQMILDFTTGVATYKYIFSFDNTLVNPDHCIENSVSIQCMCPIPVNVNNAEEISKTRDAYSANIISSVIGSLGMSAAGFAVGNPIVGFGSVINAIQTGIKGYYEKQRLIVSGSAGHASSVFTTFDLYNGYVCVAPIMGVIKYSRPVVNIDNYYHYQGHRCIKTVQLGNVYGYTEISDIHLEISNILTEESEMLISLLLEGVIFPDPPTTE